MSSASRIKKHTFTLLQHLSQGLNLPQPLALFIEFISSFQIIALTILPIVLENNISGQDDLSKTLNNLLLYTKPFEIFDPFTSGSAPIIMITLCGIYSIGFFAVLALMLHQLSQGKLINSWSKIPSFCLLLHNKVLFYPMHCFLISALDHTTISLEDSSSLAQNKAAWIIISIFLLTFNLALAIIKELFCFQIHQNQDTYGIKDNLHGLNILAHKTVVIILFYFLQDSKNTAVVLTNIVFSSITLTILHVRLPFYNLKMLKLSIVMSTIATWTSILSIVRTFDSQNKILLLLIFFTMGFAVKISLIKFTWTLKNIRNLQNLTPYHIAHLPVLINEYGIKSTLTPLQDKTTKETLYSLGFTSNFHNQNEAYSIIVKEMLVQYRQTRNNKDARELLSLSAAQIYIHIFGDALKAMVILGKLNEKNLTLTGKMSYKTLSTDLESLNYKYATMQSSENSSASHLDYFIYKLKTQTFKEYIKQEIEQHQTFWKLLSSPTVEVMPVVSQGTLISSSTNKVSRYWNANFEDNELTYVNASIMYGLYLKTLQSLPSGGAALVRKAFNSLNNKQHPNRDVIDIVLGNRAVIIASIQPDKIGKIIDTSSSVNKLFKTHKKGLIGTNIGMLMPSMIASQHNDLIKKYHRNSKQSLNRVIKTYAKTMTDKYFSIEMTLRLSPWTQNGLNVVASIEKTSEYNSVIILDYDGNIVEYSKDLADTFNLVAKKSQQQLKIETFSKELKEVNAAFNLIYSPQKSEDNLEVEKDDSTSQKDEIPIEDYFKSNTIILPRKPNDKKETLIASPRSSRPLLLSSMENDIAPSSDRKNLFIETERHNSIHIHTVQPSFTKEEAERICEIYKYGKDILFLPLNQKLTLNSKPPEIKCKTEIEPLIFQNKLYKILKIKETSSPSLPKTSLSQVPSTTTSPLLQKALSVPPNPDELTGTDTLPIEGEGEGERAKRHKCSIEPSLDIRNIRNVLPRLSQISSHVPPTNFELTKEEIPLSESFNSQKSKKKTFKAQSLVTSQFSQQATAKQLNSSLKIEKQSPEIRLAVNMIYVAVVIILGSMVVDLIYTNKSLQNMSDSIGLFGLVNARLGKTILAWHNLMSLYARSIGFRKIDAKLPFNKALALNATLDMLTNGQELLQKVDQVSDEEVSRIFYEKSISFWEPETHTLFNDKKIDSFSASNIIIDYNLYFIRYNGSLFDLKDSRRGLFAINNTANDYILSVDRTISEISTFFENTKDRNISLLKVIVSLETLFIIIPFVLAIYILVTTIKLYKKLFQALCKIHPRSHTWRITQLANIAALFEENIEDDISYFNELKAKTNVAKGQVDSSKKNQTHVSKQYREQGLVLYGLKFLLLTCVLTGLIIGLILNSFQTSIGSFKDLDSTKKQISASFDMNSRVKIAFPAFYLAAMFYNDTSYMMRNQNAAELLISGIEYLGGANAHILAALSDENGEITDSVVNRVLGGKVCDLVPSIYYSNCIYNTDGETFGLLGLQPKVYNIMMILKNWASAASPKWDAAQVALSQVSAVMNNLHFIIFELYDFLAEHLIDSFVKKTEEQKSLAEKIFWINVVVTLVTMVLIRVIVLRKLQVLDIGVRRILRIIPYKIIEENKVMGFYLVKAFGKELEILKQMV